MNPGSWPMVMFPALRMLWLLMVLMLVPDTRVACFPARFALVAAMAAFLLIVSLIIAACKSSISVLAVLKFCRTLSVVAVPVVGLVGSIAEVIF